MLSGRFPRRDERGFTLVEMLISVVILGIIIVPLANALIGVFHNTADTTGRLSESHDVQIAAAYFAQDVQSVGVHDWNTSLFPIQPSVETDVAGTAGAFPCGPASPKAAVRLAWDDPTSPTGAPVKVIAAYVVESVGTETQLHRYLCTGSSTDNIVLAHNVTSAPVICTPVCVAGVASMPDRIVMKLTIKNAATKAGIVGIELVGQRRQS